MERERILFDLPGNKETQELEVFHFPGAGDRYASAILATIKYMGGFPDNPLRLPVTAGQFKSNAINSGAEAIAKEVGEIMDGLSMCFIENPYPYDAVLAEMMGNLGNPEGVSTEHWCLWWRSDRPLISIVEAMINNAFSGFLCGFYFVNNKNMQSVPTLGHGHVLMAREV